MTKNNKFGEKCSRKSSKVATFSSICRRVYRFINFIKKMWNGSSNKINSSPSPVSSKKFQFDSNAAEHASKLNNCKGNNIKIHTNNNNSCKLATARKISFDMEIHVQNRCISTQRFTLEESEEWLHGCPLKVLKVAILGASATGKTSILQVNFFHFL